VSIVQRQLGDQIKTKTPAEAVRDTIQERLPDLTLDTSERPVFINENDDYPNYDNESAIKDDPVSNDDERGTGGKVTNSLRTFN
jgi:vacuole morphology and inheritance protein 14